jgi:TctA family transporter
MLESSLRQSLIISEGSFLIFLYRPIAGAIMVTAFFILIASSIPFLKSLKEKFEKPG